MYVEPFAEAGVCQLFPGRTNSCRGIWKHVLLYMRSGYKAVNAQGVVSFQQDKTGIHVPGAIVNARKNMTMHVGFQPVQAESGVPTLSGSPFITPPAKQRQHAECFTSDRKSVG